MPCLSCQTPNGDGPLGMSEMTAKIYGRPPGTQLRRATDLNHQNLRQVAKRKTLDFEAAFQESAESLCTAGLLSHFGNSLRMADSCRGASASPRQCALNKKCPWPGSHVTAEAESGGNGTSRPPGQLRAPRETTPRPRVGARRSCLTPLAGGWKRRRGPASRRGKGGSGARGSARREGSTPALRSDSRP